MLYICCLANVQVQLCAHLFVLVCLYTHGMIKKKDLPAQWAELCSKSQLQFNLPTVTCSFFLYILGCTVWKIAAGILIENKNKIRPRIFHLWPRRECGESGDAMQTQTSPPIVYLWLHLTISGDHYNFSFLFFFFI